MARIVENLLGGARLDEITFMKDADPIRNVFDHAQVVGDEQIGAARFVLNVFHEVDDLRLD